MGERLVHDLNRILSAWVLGEVDAPAALKALCGSVDRLEVTCGLVLRDEPIVLGEGANAELGPLLSRIAAISPERREFHTCADRLWNEVFDEARSQRGELAWVACEPVVDPDGTHRASLVLLGWSDAERDSALVTLPKLGRAAAAILAKVRASAKARALTHTLNNLLASVMANVDYAAHLVEDASPTGALATEVDREDIAHAMRNAEEAVKQMAAHVLEVATLGKR